MARPKNFEKNPKIEAVKTTARYISFLVIAFIIEAIAEKVTGTEDLKQVAGIVVPILMYVDRWLHIKAQELEANHTDLPIFMRLRGVVPF